MKIKITKMQGCGNDFVFMDYREFRKVHEKFGNKTKEQTLSQLSKQICDRHFAIGADGLIIPFPYDKSDADIAWQYYNSDGTSAQMCGNGMRCFAKYIYDKKLLKETSFRVKTLAGIIKPSILEDGRIRVNMGKPILEDEKIPFKGNHEIKINDRTFKINPVSMGNPHCIIFTDETPMDLALKFGPALECHEYFPQKTNVEFVNVISKNEVNLAVYERGCGITLACGTGACATVVAAVLNNLTEHNVKVNLPGGVLNVEWQGSEGDTNHDVFMTGAANYSFTAEYML